MGPEEFEKKSSVKEIEERFDADVERFSNLETGQTATIDAPLAMELITRAALTVTRPIHRVLDIGCGAGNNTLKLLESISPLDVDLLDLSANMLERARLRVSEKNRGIVRIIKGDIRDVDLEHGSYDVILAAAVLHHLREEDEWAAVFQKLYDLLVSGGSVWITDLVSHEISQIQALMWQRYSDYLVEAGKANGLDGERYRDTVFDYITREDSPRPVTYQLELLKRAGFSAVELLHKNSCFAAFGAVK